MRKPNTRSERLENAPLEYAPENEQGVVFLFARLFRELGFSSIERIQQGFPDCTAWRKDGTGRERRVHIEFELRSSSFLVHRHDPKKVEYIVCWRDDWQKNRPKNITIIELRTRLGHGRSVWLVPINSPYKEELDCTKRSVWSVAPWARRKDIVLYYRTRPECHIADVFEVTGEVTWGEFGAMAQVRRVVKKLGTPVHLDHMRKDKLLAHAGFLRSLMGRKDVTRHWPAICDIMAGLNPSRVPELRKLMPS